MWVIIIWGYSQQKKSISHLFCFNNMMVIVQNNDN